MRATIIVPAVAALGLGVSCIGVDAVVGELKAEVKRLEDLVGLGGDPGPGTGSERRTERPRGQLQLPNEQDVDRALNYIQRMFRKFKDKLKEFDGHYRPPTPL